MTIHHATIKKAKAHGIMMDEDGGAFRASIPEFNVFVAFDRPGIALDEAIALRKIKKEYSSWEVVAEGDIDDSDCTQITLKAKKVGVFTGKPSAAFGEAFDKWQEKLVKQSEKEDGEEEQEEEAEEEAEEERSSSVVSQTYRARYAEAGHPTHCGDWFAVLLNGMVGSKKEFNVELFEAICALNGVDTSKYKHTGNGWQGRIRMTGRNMLAKKVALRGLLLVPESMGQTIEANAEWLAAQRFVKPVTK